jgi:hypothetical protein
MLDQDLDPADAMANAVTAVEAAIAQDKETLLAQLK